MILPRLERSFTWRETSCGPALVCTALEQYAPHLFTTRHWALGQARHSNDEAWDEVAKAFGYSGHALSRLHQVHGRTAVVAEHLDRNRLPEADIIVSAAEAGVIAVQAADCVPLLIADRRRGVVAAAHAGWRGLALGVPGAVVRALAETYGSDPADLVAAIGPSIGACCYEVGPEVRETFVNGRPGEQDANRWFSETPAPSPENPSMPGISSPRPGHAFFDGWNSAVDQLIAARVPKEQVFCARLCTASHPDLLCSYRRDGRSAGRIAGAIRPSRRS
jgi:YfiH family protein